MRTALLLLALCLAAPTSFSFVAGANAESNIPPECQERLEHLVSTVQAAPEGWNEMATTALAEAISVCPSAESAREQVPPPEYTLQEIRSLLNDLPFESVACNGTKLIEGEFTITGEITVLGTRLDRHSESGSGTAFRNSLGQVTLNAAGSDLGLLATNYDWAHLNYRGLQFSTDASGATMWCSSIVNPGDACDAEGYGTYVTDVGITVQIWAQYAGLCF